MLHHLPFRTLPWFAALFAAFLSPVMGKSPDADGKKQQPQLRFICTSSLTEDQEVVLASQDDKGKWQELGTITLRASLITDWLPAQVGELHLAVREESTLKSICQFTCPTDSRRALVALIADPEKKVYNARLADPEKLEFAKGTVLIFNFSAHTGLVSLGPKEEKVEAGQQRVAKPALEENGMYRMLVSYLDAEGQTVSCYDRQTSGNANSRDMLFLLPDKTLGLRVLGLPIFGALE